MRSMAWSGPNNSWANLASTVQSRPPEKSTATLVGHVPSDGGCGILRTRSRSESSSLSFSRATAGDDRVKAELLDGKDMLKLPIPET